MVLFVLFKTTKVQAQVVDIGDISELNGSAQIVRDKPYEANLQFAIQSNDEAITTNGRMAITFLDDSTVKLTEHSQLLIDEYIYDPDPSKSKMALTFGLGTARFITGNLNRIDKQNISLKTPTANIAIRGTDFTATVDELGRSLIILLPDALGLSSGEIEVVTAMGTVILNKPYEATTVSVFESAPTKPVILDLSLDIIDNMLIVTPPKEENIVAPPDTIDEKYKAWQEGYDFNNNFKERLTGEITGMMFGDPTGGLKYQEGTDNDRTFESNRLKGLTVDELYDELQYWNEVGKNTWDIDEETQGMPVKDWFTKMFDKLNIGKEEPESKHELLKGDNYIPPKP